MENEVCLLEGETHALSHGRKVIWLKKKLVIRSLFLAQPFKTNFPKAPIHFKTIEGSEHLTKIHCAANRNNLFSVDKTVLPIIISDGLEEIQQYLKSQVPLSYFFQCHLSQSRRLLQDYGRFFKMICCLLAFLITTLGLSPMNFLMFWSYGVFFVDPTHILTERCLSSRSRKAVKRKCLHYWLRLQSGKKKKEKEKKWEQQKTSRSRGKTEEWDCPQDIRKMKWS